MTHRRSGPRRDPHRFADQSLALAVEARRGFIDVTGWGPSGNSRRCVRGADRRRFTPVRPRACRSPGAGVMNSVACAARARRRCCLGLLGRSYASSPAPSRENVGSCGNDPVAPRSSCSRARGRVDALDAMLRRSRPSRGSVRDVVCPRPGDHQRTVSRARFERTSLLPHSAWRKRKLTRSTRTPRGAVARVIEQRTLMLAPRRRPLSELEHRRPATGPVLE